MPDRLLRYAWFRKWSIPIAALLICGSLLSSALLIHVVVTSGKTSRSQLCAAINRNRAIMRQILSASLKSTKKFEKDPLRRARTIALLENDIRLTKPADCDRIVTP